MADAVGVADGFFADGLLDFGPALRDGLGEVGATEILLGQALLNGLSEGGEEFLTTDDRHFLGKLTIAERSADGGEIFTLFRRN